MVATTTTGLNGYASIVQSGTALCTFNNTAARGDYVTISTSSMTAGECQDSGLSTPVAGAIGVATSSGTGPQTVFVFTSLLSGSNIVQTVSSWGAPQVTIAADVPVSSLLAAAGTNTIGNGSYAQTWNWGSLTNGVGMTFGGPSAMTSGSLFALGTSASIPTYVHTTASEVGTLFPVAFEDGSTSTTGATTTNGISISPTINTSGAGTKTINGLNVEAPAVTGCGSGACAYNGVSITGGSGTNVTSAALNVSAGAGSGTNYAAVFQGGNVGIGQPSPPYTLSVTGQTGMTGQVYVMPLSYPAPAAPTVTPYPATGSLTYAYEVAANYAFPGTNASPVASTALATSVTLVPGSVYNTIGWTASTGATSYTVCRTALPAMSPYNLGCFPSTTATTLTDYGQSVSGVPLPGYNTTGAVGIGTTTPTRILEVHVNAPGEESALLIQNDNNLGAAGAGMVFGGFVGSTQTYLGGIDSVFTSSTAATVNIRELVSGNLINVVTLNGGAVSMVGPVTAVQYLGSTTLPPTISSGFGTSSSVVGSDSGGRVTVGSGTPSSGVIAFGTNFATAPACVANDETSFVNLRAVATTGGITITAFTGSNFGTGDKITWVCSGW